MTTARKSHNFRNESRARSRLQPLDECQNENETSCKIGLHNFCFTKNVECDGIKNCGVPNWYDENKDLCSRSRMMLPWSAILTILLVTFFGVGALAHVVVRSVPKLANAFFIFNANEDNRLFVVTVSRPDEEARSKRKPIYKFSHDLIEEAMMVYQPEVGSVDSSLRFTGQFDSSPIASSLLPNREIKATFESGTVLTHSSEFIHQQLQDLALEKKSQATSKTERAQTANATSTTEYEKSADIFEIVDPLVNGTLSQLSINVGDQTVGDKTGMKFKQAIPTLVKKLHLRVEKRNVTNDTKTQRSSHHTKKRLRQGTATKSSKKGK